ncbi:2-deoxyglucose-6-phosphate phosphatase, putative [Cordyceps militaris CM01]|uniref:2-deoxyglucose-6-phosphate phosphatase, putative n=2 Tax=Cordyceps militaris TaxID=73501 RepID=G3JHY1_CORMM|nr:2-deoxyglucose-6-phosphate phosphatase, putative [Cordyceps militaris CM01]ATY59749.1 HAD-like domain [Cordyceps militaris]EGX91784.1 2-deoxyglucose-6-phosphate phosphatase, putative [Cordyceps militaris CM01]
MTSTSGNASDADWRPKVVIFDLLTALLDSWTLWDASTPSGTEEEGRRWRARYLEITFRQGAYTPYASLIKQAATEAGVASSAPEALLGNWSSLQAWPETFHVLQQLKMRGYKLGVVTNCSKTLGNMAAVRAATSESGEQLAFDAVMTAEESGFYKPVKQAYDAILDAMGVSASEALFVAGSAGDVQGATDAGMKVVWHNHVGLAARGSAVPLRESKSLNEALKEFLY